MFFNDEMKICKGVINWFPDYKSNVKSKNVINRLSFFLFNCFY